jgi:hypothetical protein
LSSLIFVAVAVAWVVYLTPKLLAHHDELLRARSKERFSESMRVLARRDSAAAGRTVLAPARTSRRWVEAKARAPQPVVDAATPDSRKAGRTSAPSAAQRRRRVLGVIALVNLVVGGVAVAQVIAWPWVFAPLGLLVAWLVACRLMVKSERASRRKARSVPVTESRPVGVVPQQVAPAPEVVVPSPLLEAPAAATGEFDVVGTDASVGLWDPVPTTLPTYVSKPAAQRRAVPTIDLDSTGVWSSGRSEIDSALAREAEVAEKATAAQSERRAAGA